MSNFNGQFNRKKPEVAYIEVNLKNENLPLNSCFVLYKKLF